MGEIGSATKVHVVQGTPWMDAIIKLLQPGSPYRPWRGGPGPEPGDAVIALLDTDPPSVIAEVCTVGSDGVADNALTEDIGPVGGRACPPALLEFGTLVALTGLWLQHDGADLVIYDTARLLDALGDRRWPPSNLPYLHGRSTLAAARILLESRGRCTGCDRALDLESVNARYHLHIHTVDFDPTNPHTPVAYDSTPEEPRVEPVDLAYSADAIRIRPRRWRPIAIPPDWPAVLCDACHDSMRRGGFSSFLDFRFSRHPACPSCSARWTRRTVAGFMAAHPEQPWIDHPGCSAEAAWLCGACGHKWGRRLRPGG